MEYEHFGILLKELRLKHNMSREKLAENICTPKQIYRIEKGESEPSVHLLYQLSVIFDLDLNAYYKMHFIYITVTGLEGIRQINSALESGDMLLLESLILKYERLDEFHKSEPLQHIYYGKALYTALLYEDYNKSLTYCLKGIKIEFPTFCIDNINNRIYSNVGFTLLNCISQNYFALGKYFTGSKILFKLQNILETYYINSQYPIYLSTQFIIKLYQSIIYNISVHSYNNGDIYTALDYTDKGINFSLEENFIRLLPELLSLKAKLLYKQNQKKEAKELYNHAVHFYHIAGKDAMLIELEKEICTEFPELMIIK